MESHGSEQSAVERLMARGYTREQAIKQILQDSQRSQGGHHPNLSLNSISNENELHRGTSQNTLLAPPSILPQKYYRSASSDVSSGAVERALFAEEGNRDGLFDLGRTYGVTHPMDEEQLVDSLMRRGYTREQALLHARENLTVIRASDGMTATSSVHSRSHSNSQLPSYAHHERGARSNLTAANQSMDSIQFNNFVVERSLDERLAAIAVDMAALLLRRFPLCYFSVQLDDDEAFEVALLVSKGLSREGAIYVYFKERMQSRSQVSLYGWNYSLYLTPIALLFRPCPPLKFGKLPPG